MRIPARCLRATLVAALLAAPLGCRAPTEAIVEITTDGACADVAGTGVTAGLLGAIEKKGYGTTTSACQGSGDIGSIVLLPPEGDREAPFAFKIVTSLGVPVESCVAPKYGPNCIVARRAMRFVPHHPFHVPVRMDQACAGVQCPEDQSCVAGTCHSATIDPEGCDEPEGCDPTPGIPPPWQQSFGGAGSQMARHLALGADSTLVVTGNFDTSFDFGDGALKPKGGQDIFLATFSQAGAFRWSRAFGGPGLDEGLSVATDAHSDIYLLARFEETVDFGGGPLVSKGGSDIALVKLTSFGKLKWAIRFGGPTEDLPGKVAVGADGNVYVVGEITGTAGVGAAKITSAGGTDVLLASFTSDGVLRWVKALGGAGDDGGGGVAVDAAGHVYVGGYFVDQANVGGATPLAATGSADAFVASFDEAGAFRWAKSFGSNGNDHVFDVAARGDRVVATGALANHATLDGIVLQAANADGFVTAFDPDGKLVWGKVFGGAGNDQGESVDVAEDGSIVVGGEIFEGAVLGSKPLPAKIKGVRHPFVAVLEPGGEPLWARAYPSSLYAGATGVGAPSHGFAFVAGWFTGTLDVAGKKLTSDGAEDLVLVRAGPP